jgi:hypothetical protein
LVAVDGSLFRRANSLRRGAAALRLFIARFALPVLRILLVLRIAVRCRAVARGWNAASIVEMHPPKSPILAPTAGSRPGGIVDNPQTLLQNLIAEPSKETEARWLRQEFADRINAHDPAGLPGFVSEEMSADTCQTSLRIEHTATRVSVLDMESV